MMNSGMVTYSRTLQAGVTQVINVVGNLFHLRSASEAIRISFDISSSSALSLGAGAKVKIDGGFKKVYLTSVSTIDIVANIGSGDIEDAAESSGAASALANTAVTVGTGATLLKAANTGRKYLEVQPKTAPIFIGDSGVTTANGLEVSVGQTYTIYVTSAVYGISATAGVDCRVMEYA
ncbi:MAG: hypothetical protein HQL69_20440 [Magnetococcales bacterium]|nr:hypothetical protein [Magnetococcales bacterium]